MLLLQAKCFPLMILVFLSLEGSQSHQSFQLASVLNLTGNFQLSSTQDFLSFSFFLLLVQQTYYFFLVSFQMELSFMLILVDLADFIFSSILFKSTSPFSVLLMAYILFFRRPLYLKFSSSWLIDPYYSCSFSFYWEWKLFLDLLCFPTMEKLFIQRLMLMLWPDYSKFRELFFLRLLASVFLGRKRWSMGGAKASFVWIYLGNTAFQLFKQLFIYCSLSFIQGCCKISSILSLFSGWNCKI